LPSHEEIRPLLHIQKYRRDYVMKKVGPSVWLKIILFWIRVNMRLNFQIGYIEELTANIIAENLIAPVDQEG
jgi:hypothetical protein